MNDDNEETGSREYPFATDHLAKGSRVTAETIERGYGLPAGVRNDRYRMTLLKAREFVMRQFANRGEPVTVREDHDDLLVLTDEEAAKYNHEQFVIARRRMVRSHSRKMLVDRGQLSAETLATHDRQLESEGRELSAMREARRMPAVLQTQRATPLPPFANKDDDDKDAA